MRVCAVAMYQSRLFRICSCIHKSFFLFPFFLSRFLFRHKIVVESSPSLIRPYRIFTHTLSVSVSIGAPDSVSCRLLKHCLGPLHWLAQPPILSFAELGSNSGEFLVLDCERFAQRRFALLLVTFKNTRLHKH